MLYESHVKKSAEIATTTITNTATEGKPGRATNRSKSVFGLRGFDIDDPMPAILPAHENTPPSFPIKEPTCPPNPSTYAKSPASAIESNTTHRTPAANMTRDS